MISQVETGECVEFFKIDWFCIVFFVSSNNFDGFNKKWNGLQIHHVFTSAKKPSQQQASKQRATMPTVIQLAAKVDALEQMVNNLSIAGQDERKPRNMTDKGVAHKAKILFYQDNKDNTATKQKTKEVYGNELPVTFENYHKLKKCTDSLYAALPSAEQDKYLLKAKEATPPSSKSRSKSKSK